MNKLLLVVIGIVIGIVMVLILYFNSNRYDNFYNIVPTELIDPEYHNINNDSNNYYNYMRVGDTDGIDLNCNNVRAYDILQCIKGSDPHLLYQYVYKYDPSISLFNPIDAPRVLKELLKNLPHQHPCLNIIKRCPISQILIN